MIQNKYQNDFCDEAKEIDRAEFIQALLFSKKRTFRNFIDNNSNLLRKTVQHNKREVNDRLDAAERKLHNYTNN